ncbi:hypothetical protein HNY73_021008 [Argiope bruennichi]|uniref:Uncharacterized protein n=1 Tax=Argiope bruennichi TaxID=94029 RepID=A0A8T0EA10_ARGBR|nr:hypothetical protein HNY73_021008 [Argiope bruennichi]
MSPSLTSTEIVDYLIWRALLTPYHPSNILERDEYGGGSACVWSGVFWGGHTDLHIFSHETVNSQRHRNIIIDTYVQPYSGGFYTIALLLQL